MNQAILFIDSEPSWLQFAKSTVEEYGYMGLITYDAKFVKQVLDPNSDYNVLLVILDIKSLEDSHLELLSLVKVINLPVVAVFPIGVTTARARMAFKSGVSDCVDKPYDGVSLMALVEQMLAEQRIAETEILGKEATETSNVIIVEDDKDWMESILWYLPEVNYVEKVWDYTTAVEKILSRSYDLAILDLRLVDSNDNNFQGMDLVQLIREKDHERRFFTQIIIVSAFGTPDHIRDVYGKFNVYFYFDKRLFSPAIFQEAVIKSIGFAKNDTSGSVEN